MLKGKVFCLYFETMTLNPSLNNFIAKVKPDFIIVMGSSTD